jgi:hypothetical protein
MPRSDIVALVACDPLFLCSSVEKTLAPRVADLMDLGLSRPQIVHLIPLALNSVCTKSFCGNLGFWLSVFDGSFKTLHWALMLNAGILKVLGPYVECRSPQGQHRESGHAELGFPAAMRHKSIFNGLAKIDSKFSDFSYSLK